MNKSVLLSSCCQLVSFFLFLPESSFLHFLLLTLRTETEKVEAMGEDLVSCFQAHLLADFSKVDKLGVHDFLASRADHMRMWIRFAAIVAVATHIQGTQVQELHSVP